MKRSWQNFIVFKLIIHMEINNFFFIEKKGKLVNSGLYSSNIIFIKEESFKKSLSLAKFSNLNCFNIHFI